MADDKSNIVAPTSASDYRSLKTKFDQFLISDGDKYEIFKERVELFFERHEVPVDKQTGIFLNDIDVDIYKLIKDTIAPLKPKDVSMKRIFDVLDGHFNVTINVRAERFKFGQVKQEADESLADFVVRLREASGKCDFGKFIVLTDKAEETKLKLLAKEDALVDRFVMGLQNVNIQEKLLREDPKTFDDAYAQAKTMQMACEERRPLDEVNAIRAQPVHRTSRSRRQQTPLRGRMTSLSPSSVSSGGSSRGNERRSDRQGGNCGRCGFHDHFNGNCPAKDKRCDRCQRRGHFSRCCRTPREVMSIIQRIYNSGGQRGDVEIEI